MRRNIWWAFIVVATALVETTWLDRINVAGALPNLTLLLVVYFALMEGEERAMATGVLGGLFQDVARNEVLGHNVLCLVVIGYAVGRLATRLITEHPAVKAGTVLSASLAHGLLHLTVFYVQNPGLAAVRHIVSAVVPAAFYTALCTPILFAVLDRTFRRKATLQGGIP